MEIDKDNFLDNYNQIINDIDNVFNISKIIGKFCFF